MRTARSSPESIPAGMTIRSFRSSCEKSSAIAASAVTRSTSSISRSAASKISACRSACNSVNATVTEPATVCRFMSTVRSAVSRLMSTCRSRTACSMPVGRRWPGTGPESAGETKSASRTPRCIRLIIFLRISSPTLSRRRGKRFEAA